jgi:hypothetical protein
MCSKGAMGIRAQPTPNTGQKDEKIWFSYFQRNEGGNKKSKKLLLGVSYSVKFQRGEEKLRCMLARLCVRFQCFYDSRIRCRYIFFLSMDQTRKRKTQKKLMYYLRFNTEEQFTIQLFYYLMKPDVQS